MVSEDYFQIAEAKRIWGIIIGKLAKFTVKDAEAHYMLLSLNIIFNKAYAADNLKRMEWVIKKGDELKELLEAPEREKTEAKLQGRQIKSDRETARQKRRQEQAAQRLSALDEVLKDLKPGRARQDVPTQGLAEAERLYREREHIVAHGKKRARPTKKGNKGH